MTDQVFQLQPRLLTPGAGPTLSFLGVNLAYKVSSADTAGAWALLEYVAPPKFAGPPLHWHKVTNEAFYVLEGVVTFRKGEEVFKGEPGAMVYIPTGILHTFSNQEDTPARFLTFLSPGGFEEYFKELAALAQSEPIWPPKDMKKLLALYEKYDNFFPEK
ncbi:MAG: cupin domain-containing protein [Anaerolineales bacterium]|nr:cupin domain-containing protein [Anaerolineales bacterium]